MYSQWVDHDFLREVAPSRHVQDIWDPCSSVAEFDPPEVRNTPSGGDFWDPAPVEIDSAPSVQLAQWLDHCPVPLFDAKASENPFAARFKQWAPESEARRRARWLASLLDIPTAAQRLAYQREFIAIFEFYPHSNSFRAVSELALDGFSADEIVAAFHLKVAWSDRPRFWSRRYKSRALYISDDGHRMMTWRLAAKLVSISNGIPVDFIVSDDWYDDWLELPRGDPLSWAFLDYVVARLKAFSQGVLQIPRELLRVDERGLPHPSFGGNSIDGCGVGTRSRTGYLARAATDAWAISAYSQDKSKAVSN
jgi:hypothetical protein